MRMVVVISARRLAGDDFLLVTTIPATGDIKQGGCVDLLGVIHDHILLGLVQDQILLGVIQYYGLLGMIKNHIPGSQPMHDSGSHTTRMMWSC